MTQPLPPPTRWSSEKCHKYRVTIMNRMEKNPEMTLENDLPTKAFIQGEPVELILYQTIRFVNYNMKDLKESAFEQISVVCGYGEPMSLDTIYEDFATTDDSREFPKSTKKIFDYITENAPTLLEEMVSLGILEQVLLS